MNQYGYIGPPFNFLGHLSQSQWEAFKPWAEEQAKNCANASTFHRIRAQNLRKTAGLAESYFSKVGMPGPTFKKASWQPGPDGHFGYKNRDDHMPMVTMSKVKQYLQAPLGRVDESVFFQNYLRTQIERHEDAAQYQADAVTEVETLLGEIDNAFQEPRYQAALVKDKTDLYNGEPRFRTHQLDNPTAWELALTNRTIKQ